MFNVVIGKEWCSVVPKSWINPDNKTCLWPTNKKDITKAVKHLRDPEKSWKSTSVKYILGPYGINIYVRQFYNQL